MANKIENLKFIRLVTNKVVTFHFILQLFSLINCKKGRNNTPFPYYFFTILYTVVLLIPTIFEISFGVYILLAYNCLIYLRFSSES